MTNVWIKRLTNWLEGDGEKEIDEGGGEGRKGGVD